MPGMSTPQSATNVSFQRLKNIPMADMMTSLPDGTKKHCLEELASKTAEDIRACANCCDVYGKKKTIYKVLAGRQWDQKLARFAGVFSSRKHEFLVTLSIRTATEIGKVERQVFSDSIRQEQQAAMISAK
jgi:hypothetical protein